jgi:hypothetical protein
MRKYLPLVVVSLAALSLTGCGGGASDEATPAATEEPAPAASATDDTAAPTDATTDDSGDKGMSAGDAANTGDHP